MKTSQTFPISPESTPVSSSSYATAEYHIIYSPSYHVPVLYFRGYTQEGTPLSPLQLLKQHDPNQAKNSAIEDNVVVEVNNSINDNANNNREPSSVPPIFSHEEHPFLKQPYYMLHPCRTRDILEVLNTAPLCEDEDGDCAACGADIGRTINERKQTNAVNIPPVRQLLAWLSIAVQQLRYVDFTTNDFIAIYKQTI